MVRIFVAGILAALVGPAAGGQTIITESDYLSILDGSYPAVVAAAEELAIARSNLVAASTFENPSIGLVREDPSGDAAQTDAMISWQLPDFGRRLEIEAREKEVAAAQARLAHERAALRVSMREAYADWALASARADRLYAQRTRLDELARREARRAESGEVSGLEARRLLLAASSLGAQHALASATEEEMRAKARRWSSTIPADAKPRLPEASAFPESAEDHPLVLAAEADLAAALAAEGAAKRFLRAPELMAGWQRQEDGPDTVDGPLYGINWSIPLFGRNQAGKSAAAARVEAARARLDQTRREVESSRQGALAAYRRLAEQIEAIGPALEGNDRTLEGAEAAFLLGEASLTDLLETHRAVTEAEMALLELREAALAASRELERLGFFDSVQTHNDSKEPHS
jgi:outer membrane protein, heavy metal efflux system